MKGDRARGAVLKLRSFMQGKPLRRRLGRGQAAATRSYQEWADSFQEPDRQQEGTARRT